MDDKQEKDSIEAQTPLGRFKILGNEKGLAIFALAAAAYFAWVHHEGSKADSQRIVQELSALRESNVETVYVLSLPQSERDKLNIAIPESLRKRIRRGGRDEP